MISEIGRLPLNVRTLMKGWPIAGGKAGHQSPQIHDTLQTASGRLRQYLLQLLSLRNSSWPSPLEGRCFCSERWPRVQEIPRKLLPLRPLLPPPPPPPPPPPLSGLVHSVLLQPISILSPRKPHPPRPVVISSRILFPHIRRHSIPRPSRWWSDGEVPSR